MKQNQMTTKAKLKYISNYPIKSVHLCENEVVYTEEYSLSDALSGVGFYFLTGEDVISYTGSAVNLEGELILKDDFYLNDTSEAEDSDIRAYSLIGSDILSAIKEAANVPYLQLDYKEQDYYEILDVNGVEIEYDFIERELDLLLFEKSFSEEIPAYLLSLEYFYPELIGQEVGKLSIGQQTVALRLELEGEEISKEERIKEAEKQHGEKNIEVMKNEYEWVLGMLDK